jgi:general stress protein YciG
MTEEVTKKKRGVALFSAEERMRFAQMGGLAVSKNRKHMSEIGKKGGLATSKDKEHMKELGRRGGSNKKKRAHDEQEAETKLTQADAKQTEGE